MSYSSGVQPLELLHPLAVQESEECPGLTHIEIHTMEGLLGILRHGPPRAESAVLLCGGGQGGFLGPADSLYPWLGHQLAERGVLTLRVDYRLPSRLEPCVLDACVAADLAAQAGATSFVVVGHSFGGAVAVNVAVALPTHVRGVVTLATQSAGCETAASRYGQRPLLLVHGDGDQVLNPQCSETVRRLAGAGELVLLPGQDHGLSGAAGWLRDTLPSWIVATLGGEHPRVTPLG